MPELPEVEAARRQVAKNCLNKKLLKVDFTECGGHARDGSFDDIVIDESLKDGKELVNRTLVNTTRKGKYIIWEFSLPGRQLVFHFGMTGNFRIKGVNDFVHYRSSSIKPDKEAPTVEPKTKKVKQDKKAAAEDDEGDGADEEIIVTAGAKWPPRFTKALFYFEDDIIVAFTDPRRLGRLIGRAKPLEEEPVGELAADPIHEMPSIDAFRQLVSTAGTREIKTVLLDQNKIVCGIGNYLADEILHQSCIHPCQRVHELTEEETDKLRDSILNVCTTACKCLEEKRDFPESWLFHGRWAPKKARDSNPERLHIEEIKVGGRTTLFDPQRQLLHKSKVGGKSKNTDENEKEAKTATKKKASKKSDKKQAKEKLTAAASQEAKTKVSSAKASTKKAKAKSSQ